MAVIVSFSNLSRAIRQSSAEKATSYTHRLHHSNAAEYNHWDCRKSEFYNVERNGRRFGLVLLDEAHQRENRKRIILFGRELLGKRKATGNTARVTFNSNNLTKDGYFVRPRLKPAHRRAMQFSIGTTKGFPRFEEGHIVLGGGPPSELLERFLDALARVEDVKNTSLGELERRYPDGATFSVEDIKSIRFNEGERKTVTRNVRNRSDRLRRLAVEFYKSQSPDGKLRCFVDGWAPSIPTKSVIVEIHHDDALAGFPAEGKILTFEQAIKYLFPLCPNCHGLLHAKLGNSRYSVPELRSLLSRGRNSR